VNANGELFEKTIRRVGRLGNIFPTITPEAVPTGGAKTASLGFATTSSASAWLWRSGMDKIRF
jgi:hypothetical protein